MAPTKKTLSVAEATARYGVPPRYQSIGMGVCSAVFAQAGGSVVVKVAKQDNGKLFNDYNMHRRIGEEMRQHGVANIKIPACHYYVPREKRGYFESRRELSMAARTACSIPTDVLVTERIRPLPEIVREFLTMSFCPEHFQNRALLDPANRDCLARTYLGSMDGNTDAVFSLRNFNLHLNQMIDVSLQVEKLGHSVGEALAVMHWAAETDARGVEFVLGSPSLSETLAMKPRPLKRILRHEFGSESSSKLSFEETHERQTVDLWVLDFDEVRGISLDERGVEQALDAAMANDPYIPRPPPKQGAREEQAKTWHAFCESYLALSRAVLAKKGEDLLRLPELFIQGLVEMGEGKP